jgi:hypothetical protein
LKQLQENTKQNNTMQHTAITNNVIQNYTRYRTTITTHRTIMYERTHSSILYSTRELIFFSDVFLFPFLLLAHAFCRVANTYTANTQNKKNIYKDQITTQIPTAKI